MKPVILHSDEIASHIDPHEVIDVISQTFVDFSQEEIQMPHPAHFSPEGGIVHIKSAVRPNKSYAIKTAAIFLENANKGLSSIQGSITLYNGKTGEPAVFLLDNAMLTHHRTAAAGAVGAKFCSRKNSEVVVIIGTGTQARMQLEYLTYVRPVTRVILYGRSQEHVEQCAADISAKHPDLYIEVSKDLQHSCLQADIIVSTTASRCPLVFANWIKPGTHINAVGSDNPGKQELDPYLLTKALYITDSTKQCAKNGELQHAIAKNICTENYVHAQIGEVISGTKSGRTSDECITIFDSTGLGAQDLAIAELIAKKSGVPLEVNDCVPNS